MRGQKYIFMGFFLPYLADHLDAHPTRKEPRSAHPCETRLSVVTVGDTAIHNPLVFRALCLLSEVAAEEDLGFTDRANYAFLLHLKLPSMFLLYVRSPYRRAGYSGPLRVTLFRGKLLSVKSSRTDGMALPRLDPGCQGRGHLSYP